MKKTVAEMESQVLVYCTTVCPLVGSRKVIYEGAYLERGRRDVSIGHSWDSSGVGNASIICSLDLAGGNPANKVILFYRLLIQLP